MYYFDNASTTQVYSKCEEIFKIYCFEKYFNPSALYRYSTDVKNKVEECRKVIANSIKANADEIIFTSSGSESDNLALFGSKKQKGSRIISSKAEHSAVYNSVLELKNRGYEVVFAETNSDGSVNEESLYGLINDNTSLISIMHVNNQTGAINNISEISKKAKRINNNLIFHSDGVQAFGKVPFRLDNSNVDLYSASGHKIHAPKGVGFLYARKGVKLAPLIYGGGQERGYRSSTENVPSIISFAYAVEEINRKSSDENKNKIKGIAERVLREINDVKIITDFNNCSPYILCLAFKGIKSEVLMHALEKYDIVVGTGSACNSLKGNLRLSEELKLKDEYSNGIIRISVSEFNTEKECEFLSDKLIFEYKKLKNIIGG